MRRLIAAGLVAGFILGLAGAAWATQLPEPGQADISFSKLLSSTTEQGLEVQYGVAARTAVLLRREAVSLAAGRREETSLSVMNRFGPRVAGHLGVFGDGSRDAGFVVGVRTVQPLRLNACTVAAGAEYRLGKDDGLATARAELGVEVVPDWTLAVGAEVFAPSGGAAEIKPYVGLATRFSPAGFFE